MAIYQDNPVATEKCDLALFVIVWAVIYGDDLFCITERVWGLEALDVNEFEQWMLDLRPMTHGSSSNMTAPFNAQTVEPGTELAKALTMELAPYLATDE